MRIAREDEVAKSVGWLRLVVWREREWNAYGLELADAKRCGVLLRRRRLLLVVQRTRTFV